MQVKRFILNVIWEPGSSHEPTMSFVQHEKGKWCKAENVELLERRLERFASPNALSRAWCWLFGRNPRVRQVG